MNPEFNRIYEGDCLDIMRGWPDECIDLVATDPPYGIGYKSNVRTGYNNKTARRADASFGADEVVSSEVWKECFRVLKTGGGIYAFASWDGLGVLKNDLIEAGFSSPVRIVWDKVNWGSGDLRYYGSQTEDILFAAKGAHQLRTEKREGNIWQVWKAEMWNQAGGHTGHPNEKPLSLMTIPIIKSSDKGMVVLDPFCGSGTTPTAAAAAGRRFIGIEKVHKWVEQSVARTDAELAQGKLL